MILFPALDLLGGECVRLERGDRAKATIYNPDPLDQARHFLGQGARALHIVDLDAAFDGQSKNASVLEKILCEAKKHDAFVQLGGGLRSKEAVERWLKAGVGRVVIATLALENLPLALTLCEEWHEKIAIALDLREGKVATRGWLVENDFPESNLAESNLGEHDLHPRAWLAPFLEPNCKIGAVVVTDIARDGMLSGNNETLTLSVAHSLHHLPDPCPVIASGGIASLDDLRALAGTGVVAGAICGRALYEGKFSLEAALVASR